ncbi:hypothetical protein [Sphingobacterium sp. MYb382]|uniref:hypothetical protein n=1 Tax=Sphingobacterium sp. MYb382 TaxID=2745278 RepID=UPI00309FFFE8
MKSITRFTKLSLCFPLLLLFISACSKKDHPVDEPKDDFSYEVTCNKCDITYTDQTNTQKTVTNNQGKWSYRFNAITTFELNLSIKTVLTTDQTIEAYILKNNDVVYGGMGYNHAIVSYDTKQEKGTATYGARQNGNSGSNGSGNTGGNSQPQSSVCGAKNKTKAGYCQRVVVGGGRCWQH